ncbi:hypothetical protein EJ06DRAFT_261285 [Trichodelitschia bisporula]|uniref:Uncharacterized protein n=1 Tax=Trichodelitschia bisporula TaxID=703511 RepID=A0A6G1HIP1_9PEZI|nr:hypothetical protein EJ06DRAFT_261285 [Trichodelitschia bisporula]
MQCTSTQGATNTKRKRHHSLSPPLRGHRELEEAGASPTSLPPPLLSSLLFRTLFVPKSSLPPSSKQRPRHPHLKPSPQYHQTPHPSPPSYLVSFLTVRSFDPLTRSYARSSVSRWLLPCEPRE